MLEEYFLLNLASVIHFFITRRLYKSFSDENSPSFAQHYVTLSPFRSEKVKMFVQNDSVLFAKTPEPYPVCNGQADVMNR